MHPFTLSELLERAVAVDSEGVAIERADEALTYEQLDTEVRNAAARLYELGARKGDHVCIHLPKSIQEVVVCLACASLGCVFVNVNSQVTVRQLRHALTHSQSKLLFASARKTAALVDKGVPDSLKRIAVDGVLEDITDSRLASWGEIDGSEADRRVRVIDRDPCAIMYTSGSTGMPKGVLLTHGLVVQSARSSASHLRNQHDDKALGVLPLSFDYGLSQLTTMLLVGGTLVLPRASVPMELLKTVRDKAVNAIAMVPTMWIPFVRMLAKQGETLEQIRYVANSGGPLPTDVQRMWPGTFPRARHYLMYGMTEGFRSSYLPAEDFERKLGSIGVALPNVELYVVHPEHGLCGPGEHGELLHRSNMISSGYYNDLQATSEKIKPNSHLEPLIGDEPVLHSGDTVYKDEDGYLWFVARTTTFIKCSDFRISPTEVEDVIFSSGLVSDVVAFGVKDESLGQVVHVAASSVDGGPLDVAAVLKHCRKDMPPYMVPRSIHEWAGEMPRTANGKVDRPAVIASYTGGKDATPSPDIALAKSQTVLTTGA